MPRSVVQEIEQIQEIGGLGKRAGGSRQAGCEQTRGPLYRDPPASSPGALRGQGVPLPRAGPLFGFPFLPHQLEGHRVPQEASSRGRQL